MAKYNGKVLEVEERKSPRRRGTRIRASEDGLRGASRRRLGWKARDSVNFASLSDFDGLTALGEC